MVIYFKEEHKIVDCKWLVEGATRQLCQLEGIQNVGLLQVEELKVDYQYPGTAVVRFPLARVSTTPILSPISGIPSHAYIHRFSWLCMSHRVSLVTMKT